MSKPVCIYNYHLDVLCWTVQEHNDLLRTFPYSDIPRLFWAKATPLVERIPSSPLTAVALEKEEGTLDDQWHYHFHHAENCILAFAFKKAVALSTSNILDIIVRKGWTNVVNGNPSEETLRLISQPRRLSVV